MQYRLIWLIFFAVLFIVGTTVAIRPTSVISAMRQTGIGSQPRYVLGFRMLGAVVSIIALGEIISIMIRGRLL